VPGWGDLRHMQLSLMFAVVTPTRDCVATSPLKGEVGDPQRHPSTREQFAVGFKEQVAGAQRMPQ